MQDLDWDRGTWGLLDFEGRRRPAVAALQAVFGAIPRETDAIGCRGAGPGLAATIFWTRRSLFLALVNLTSEARLIRAELRWFLTGMEHFRILRIYPETATQPTIELRSSGLAIRMPAQAIVLLGDSADG